MATVLLIRHGRSSANAAGLLAGRAPGVGLDEVGREQAERVAKRLAGVKIAAAFSSPLQRCVETAAIALAGRPEASVEERLIECDYGEWTSRPLAELASEPLWATIQATPSRVAFPAGESMAAMSRRASAAVREIDAAVDAEHGPAAVWVAVTHADIVKAIVADAVGLPLDRFQRLVANPASVSVVHYGEADSALLAFNTLAGPISAYLGAAQPAADVGGGLGAGGQPGPA